MQVTLPDWAQHPFLTLLCRFGVGGFFIYAAIGKVGNVEVFAKDIAAYEMFPPASNFLALTFPWAEMVVGLGLIVGLWQRASALGSILLLIVFMVAIGWAMYWGLEVDCGCLGSDGPVGWGTMLRDVALLLMALQVLISRRPGPALLPD